MKFSIVNKDQGLITTQSDKSFLGASCHSIVKKMLCPKILMSIIGFAKMKAKIEIGLASVLPEKHKNNEIFENVVP